MLIMKVSRTETRRAACGSYNVALRACRKLGLVASLGVCIVLVFATGSAAQTPGETSASDAQSQNESAIAAKTQKKSKKEARQEASAALPTVLMDVSRDPKQLDL